MLKELINLSFHLNERCIRSGLIDRRLLFHSFPLLQSRHPSIGSRFQYSGKDNSENRIESQGGGSPVHSFKTSCLSEQVFKNLISLPYWKYNLFACRYADLMQFFPRGRSVLCEAFNYMIEFIITRKGHVLEDINAQWLSNERIRDLCKDVCLKGSPYKHCFGFVDGTVKGICRPTIEQREVNT